MASWNEAQSSTPSFLGDPIDQEYAPDSIKDPTFRGIALDCPEVCRIHKFEPVRRVTFEGCNVGCRFFLCQVQNLQENCGFVAWGDEEWSETERNALQRLWGMYADANAAIIDKRIENAWLVKQLADEKNMIHKKHSSLLADMKKFMDETEKKVMQEKDAKIMRSSATAEESLQKNEVLKNEAKMLKQVQETQADIMKVRQKKCDDENEAMKEEKKKLKYMLFDMLKARISDEGANNNRLMWIKTICDVKSVSF